MKNFFKSVSASEAEKILLENSSRGDFFVLDVRTPEEFSQKHLPGARNLDFYSSDFRSDLEKLSRKKTFLVYCRSGSRSKAVMEIMRQTGFEKVYELDGGIISLNF